MGDQLLAADAGGIDDIGDEALLEPIAPLALSPDIGAGIDAVEDGLVVSVVVGVGTLSRLLHALIDIAAAISRARPIQRFRDWE